MKFSAKVGMVLLSGAVLALAGCSSTNKGAGVDNSYGAQSSGLGNQGPFVGSDYMAKLLGIDKNTVYFDFNSNSVSQKYMYVIQANANYLKSHPSAKVRLEGNTDPRGSREYNIGLGQRRAAAVAQQLESMGVPDSQLVTVSYGQERPAVDGSDEQAFALDRRVDVIYITK